MPKVPRCFVLDLTHKLAEGGVEDRTGQLGFRKSLRVQILEADAVVLPRQVGRQLVEETRQTARRELAALDDRTERLQALERDRDALLKNYTEMTPEALDVLQPE